MIFCYIDESGNPESSSNTSHYVLAGLCIPIGKWSWCEQKVQRIKDKYALENAEIHTGWLLRPYSEQQSIANFANLDQDERRRKVERKRRAELLRLQQSPQTVKQYHKTKKTYKQTAAYNHLTFDERKSFVAEVAKLIGGWTFCRLFAECIDKVHFDPTRSRLSVDEQAFEQIVSRFEQYLQIYSKTSGIKQYGLLIHDNNQTVCKRHTNLMKQFHKTGTLWTSVKNIIETPLFVDSELTGMIQLADVCAYSLRRYLENSEDFLFKHVFKCADSKKGKVVGVRHFSDHTCTCQICQSH